MQEGKSCQHISATLSSHAELNRNLEFCQAPHHEYSWSLDGYDLLALVGRERGDRCLLTGGLY